jgi:hypothetical protein
VPDPSNIYGSTFGGYLTEEAILKQVHELEVHSTIELCPALSRMLGEEIQQSALQIAIREHGLTIDLLLLSAGTVGWAEGDQVLLGVLFDLRPGDDVVYLNGGLAAGGNGAPMA